MASLFPVPFYAVAVSEEDKDSSGFALAFVPTLPDLSTNADLIHLGVTCS